MNALPSGNAESDAETEPVQFKLDNMESRPHLETDQLDAPIEIVRSLHHMQVQGRGKDKSLRDATTSTSQMHTSSLQTPVTISPRDISSSNSTNKGNFDIESPPKIIFNGEIYYSHLEVLRLHAELSVLEKSDPKSLKDLRRQVRSPTVSDETAHSLSAASFQATTEIYKLKARVHELEEIIADSDEYIEELHTEWEEELKKQLEGQRMYLTGRRRAVKLAASREKEKHIMRAQVEILMK